ncbi:MAG TPA: holo-ACP synthase [candidate division Zixibacteria bacterium]|nr:holo-ACP synthase [candidate division Zixibacteria bacterium]
MGEITVIIGLGIDRIEIARIAQTEARYGKRFARRVYTESEWAYCRSRPHPAQSLAARFAAKEAAMKALGLGWPGGISYTDIEVVRARSGAPSLAFRGRAAALAEKRGVAHAVVSLTHDRTHAEATVILEDGVSSDNR